MNIRYYCLCTCIFIVDSSYFLFRKGRTLCKSTKINWIMCQILSSSVCHSSISHNCLANLPWMLPENGWFQLSTYDNICISNRQESEPGAQQNLWCEILEF